jgi:hypothetical protein
MVALLATDDVDPSPESVSTSPLLSNDLYAVDMLKIVLTL